MFAIPVLLVNTTGYCAPGFAPDALSTGLADIVTVSIFPSRLRKHVALLPQLMSETVCVAGGVQHNRLRSALVIAETALGVMLLVGAGLLLLSRRPFCGAVTARRRDRAQADSSGGSRRARRRRQPALLDDARDQRNRANAL